MICVALEIGSKFDFQGDSGVTTDPETIQVAAELVGSRALVTTITGSLKPIQEILRPKLGVLRLS